MKEAGRFVHRESPSFFLRPMNRGFEADGGETRIGLGTDSRNAIGLAALPLCSGSTEDLIYSALCWFISGSN